MCQTEGQFHYLVRWAGAGEMAQKLNALGVLPEDVGSISSSSQQTVIPGDPTLSYRHKEKKINH